MAASHHTSVSASVAYQRRTATSETNRIDALLGYDEPIVHQLKVKNGPDMKPKIEDSETSISTKSSPNPVTDFKSILENAAELPSNEPHDNTIIIHPTKNENLPSPHSSIFASYPEPEEESGKKYSVYTQYEVDALESEIKEENERKRKAIVPYRAYCRYRVTYFVLISTNQHDNYNQKLLIK